MEVLEQKFDDDYLYRMRDEVLKKLEKSAEFQELSREAEALSGKFPVITDLFEGTHMEDAYELTKEERQAIRKYVGLHSRIMEMHEFAHYYRGHGDCILHLSRCGILNETESAKLEHSRFVGCKEAVCKEADGRGKTGLSIQDMKELIQIHDAYKALNTALFGGEMSLMYYEGYMGALGRIYEVIDRHVLESMKPDSTEILADTSMEPEKRARMLLQGKDN